PVFAEAGRSADVPFPSCGEHPDMATAPTANKAPRVWSPLGRRGLPVPGSTGSPSERERGFESGPLYNGLRRHREHPDERKQTRPAVPLRALTPPIICGIYTECHSNRRTIICCVSFARLRRAAPQLPSLAHHLEVRMPKRHL